MKDQDHGVKDALQTIHSLRSIRSFSEREIDEEDLNRILEATVRTVAEW
jgi:nitroreductase